MGLAAAMVVVCGLAVNPHHIKALDTESGVLSFTDNTAVELPIDDSACRAEIRQRLGVKVVEPFEATIKCPDDQEGRVLIKGHDYLVCYDGRYGKVTDAGSSIQMPSFSTRYQRVQGAAVDGPCSAELDHVNTPVEGVGVLHCERAATSDGYRWVSGQYTENVRLDTVSPVELDMGHGNSVTIDASMLWQDASNKP